MVSSSISVPNLPVQLAASALVQLLPRLVAGDAAASEAELAVAWARRWAAAAARQLQALAVACQQPGPAEAIGSGGNAAPSAALALLLPPQHQLFEEIYGCWLALWAVAAGGQASLIGGEAVAAAVSGLDRGPVGGAAMERSTPQLAAVAGIAAAAWQQAAVGEQVSSIDLGQLMFLV